MAGEERTETALARALLRAGGVAALATLEPGGGPFSSYVVTAPAADGSPLLLLSRLAAHSRNLKRDSRASLLLVREPAPGSDAMAAARLTLTGRALKDDDPRSLNLYVARHPDAASYSTFADFSVYRFELAAGHLVAGFGRIVGLERDELLAPA